VPANFAKMPKTGQLANLVFAIGVANQKPGARAASAWLLWQKWREYARMAATYPAAD